MTTAGDPADLAAYARAVRALLDHGGFERSGDVQQAKRWDIAHVAAWLDGLGRPDRRRTVHIAGSKGKGSVATMTEAILRAAGAHTLLMTSPDLHAARERIAIDGAPVDHATFARLAEQVLVDPACAAWSYFELLTAMGWLAGAQAGCDWQVVEVGLGGRLDTTNAMGSKEVAVITPIDLEHVEILGDTVPAIAGEKAGIIIGPCEVVAGPMRESALEVVRARAAEVGATVHAVAEECAMRVTSMTLDGQELDLRTPVRLYTGLRVASVGPYQSENLATAVRAAELAWAATGEELPEAAVREGIRSLRLPGRAEVIRRSPLVILDGLHTPLAAQRFAEVLRTLPIPARRVWVIGVLSGKDIEGMLEALIHEGDRAIVVAPPSPRAADPAEIARAVRARGALVQIAGTVEDALTRAMEAAGPGGAVPVVGSLYTVAAAREHLLGIAGDRDLELR